MPKAQFLQQRPGGDYQKYLSYLARNRPGWNPQTPHVSQRIAPPTRGPIPTYASLLSRINFLSPQAQMSQANQMANLDLKSQQALIQSDYADRMKQAMAQQLASQAAGRAAAAMNSQLMGLVGSGYSGAADQLNTLGGSLGAAMAGASAADVAAAGATAGNVGAPAPSVGGGSPIAGPSQQGVEVFRGATLPAEALGTAGTAAQTGLGGLIGAQNLRATQEAQAAYMQALGDANQARTSAVRTLLQQRPDLAAKYLLQLQDNQRQSIALASGLIGQMQNVKQARFQRGVTRTQLGMQQAKLAADLSAQQWEEQFKTKQLSQQDRQFYSGLKAKAAAAQVQMGEISPSVSRTLGYLSNRYGMAIRGKDGKPIAVKTYGSRSTGGLTAYEYSNLVQKSQNLVEGMYYGYTNTSTGRRVPVNQAPGFDPATSKFGTGTLDYGPALQRLTKMGLSEQDARDMLNQYWTTPGQHGRPIWDSTAQQNAVKKHYGPKHYKWFVDNITRALQAGNTAEAMRWRNYALTGQNPGWATPVQ